MSINEVIFPPAVQDYTIHSIFAMCSVTEKKLCSRLLIANISVLHAFKKKKNKIKRPLAERLAKYKKQSTGARRENITQCEIDFLHNKVETDF